MMLNPFIPQDFDLCSNCYERDGHEHKMEKLGLDLDDGSSPGDQRQANPQVFTFALCIWEYELTILCVAGGEKIVHTEMYSVVGARLSVQRCQLQASQLPKDEAGGATHQDVQAEDQRWLSYMQATDCSLLLPR
jgi:hypothetical protein